MQWKRVLIVKETLYLRADSMSKIFSRQSSYKQVKKVLPKRPVEATTMQTKISSEINKKMPVTNDSRLTKDVTSHHQKGAFLRGFK